LKKQNPTEERIRYKVQDTDPNIYSKFLSYLYSDYIYYEYIEEIVALGGKYRVPHLLEYKDFLTFKITRTPESTIIADFMKGLAPGGQITELFGNVTFKIRDQEIKSHKVFLCTRTEYFYAMFDRKMLESQSNCIYIGDDNDITSEAVQAMLDFLYTDNLDIDVNVAIELLPLASQYNLIRCVDLCENIVMKGVEIDTVVYVLQLAKLHNATKLVQFCSNIISVHWGQVVKTEYYSQLPQNEKDEIQQNHFFNLKENLITKNPLNK